jgi:hypothetical protein
MRSLIYPTLCLIALSGCASPPPKQATPAQLADERAQRLINNSIENGDAINTADGKSLICRQETVTNTRLKNKKICLTEEQWRERTNNAKDGLDDARRQGEYLPPKGN